MAWTTIKVSSAEVTWPSQCACCNDPLETTIEISGQQVTGARYVQLKVQRWVVPYCRKCREHVEAGQQAEEAAVMSRQLPHDAQQLRTQAGTVDVSGARTRTFGRLLAVPLFLAGAVVLSWVVAIFLEVSTDQPGKVAAAVAAGIVLAAAATALFLLLWRSKEREAVQLAEEEKARLLAKAAEAETSAEVLQKKSELLTEKCKSLLKPACSLHAIAVIYDGWYGNTHTFRFHNPTFVEAFRQANAAILVAAT